MWELLQAITFKPFMMRDTVEEIRDRLAGSEAWFRKAESTNPDFFDPHLKSVEEKMKEEINKLKVIFKEEIRKCILDDDYRQAMKDFMETSDICKNYREMGDLYNEVIESLIQDDPRIFSDCPSHTNTKFKVFQGISFVLV